MNNPYHWIPTDLFEALRMTFDEYFISLSIDFLASNPCLIIVHQEKAWQMNIKNNCKNNVITSSLKVMSNEALKKSIFDLPKAELHVHIEGTMEPEQYLFFAERNKISIDYKSVQEAHKAYDFSDFITFINAYIRLTHVLCTQQDFYDLTFAYLKKASTQGIMHTELFFDLQTHLQRGIPADIIINGIHQALNDGTASFGISGAMILCFVRNFGKEDALKTLKLSLPFKDKITGVGLASIENGNPPAQFKEIFKQARALGYHCVAHQGECSAAMIEDVIKLLHVERIDHGIHAVENPSLLQEIKQKKIALTICPLSNRALGVTKNLHPYPLKQMLDDGILVTINSDDPAFFKSYIADNYYYAFTHLGLSFDDLITCARNSFQASFASKERKEELLKKLDQFIQQ